MAHMASEIAVRLALVGKFPELARSPFEITSDQNPFYNCIAWAAGDTENFWWPGVFWPKSAPRKVTRESFVRAFATRGFKPCDSPDLEDGYEKVALYEKDGEPTHAARLLPNGRWTSKLGKFHDISHDLDGLNGDEYGTPVLFLRRATPS